MNDFKCKCRFIILSLIVNMFIQMYTCNFYHFEPDTQNIDPGMCSTHVHMQIYHFQAATQNQSQEHVLHMHLCRFIILSLIHKMQSQEHVVYLHMQIQIYHDEPNAHLAACLTELQKTSIVCFNSDWLHFLVVLVLCKCQQLQGWVSSKL